MYKSEHGQDKWLNENVFKNKNHGVFVEIGAYNGVDYSNSYFYENILSWSGIIIEPIPEHCEHARKHRKCKVIEAAIDTQDGEGILSVVPNCKGWSGLTKSIEEKHWQRIKDHGFEKYEIKVKTKNINNILFENGIKKIDYMSIDVEGNEGMILKSINFDEYEIDVIEVETNFAPGIYHNFMIEKGYVPLERLGVNDIYWRAS